MATYYNYLGVAMPVGDAPTTNIYGTGDPGQTIYAPTGDSTVDTEGGANDIIVGSDGDQTYYLKVPSDTVQLADNLTGIKNLVSYQYGVLPDGATNLTFYGAENWGIGNSGNNLIIMGGNDENYMDGGGGNDVFVGGDGKNNYGITANTGSDVIYNFHVSQDTVRMPGTSFTNFAQVQSAMTQVGPDVVLQLDPNDTLTFRNTQVANFTPTNFLLPLDTSKLGALTFDDEFNSNQQFNFSTGQGLWRTNFGGDPNSINTYTITSNQEEEAYTDANFQGTANHALGYDPFTYANGILTITAQKFAPADSQYTFGQPYSSGMLNTKDIFAQQYGYFDMRAELPAGLGTWPAFWLSQDPYKPGVEADILEHLGLQPNVDYYRANDAGNVNGGSIYLPTNLTGFHDYGLLWTPTTTTFYIDNLAVMSMPTPASWNQPMYLIIDLAMGGWGGPVDESALPAQMQIDYVRVYGLADGSQIVQQSTPAGPAGTLSADGAPVALANSGGWTDVTALANGQLVMVSSIDSGYGSHSGQAMIYDPDSGAQVGSNISLYGYAASGQTMDPQLTALSGSFWQVSYAGSNAPQGFEIYDSSGNSAFFDNQYTQGDPVFTPLTSASHVLTNSAWTSFAVVAPDGTTNWYSDPVVAGQSTNPTEVHALTNGGFYFTYAGQAQIDVFDPTGAQDMTGQLGAPVSSFAMASDAMPNGQFGVAWLSPPADGSNNMNLTFETFGANGQALTQAATVATDADPWHTELKVIATGNAGEALMLWSQGGAIEGAFAHGSTIDAAQPLIVGNLDSTTQTALTDGHVLLTWLQTDSGVQDLWAEILDPSTMTGATEELGPADGNVHVVALANGAYAASWHSGSVIDARGYDGSGHYGDVTTVSGDFIGRDAAGDVVAIYSAADGSALLQHYSMTVY